MSGSSEDDPRTPRTPPTPPRTPSSLGGNVSRNSGEKTPRVSTCDTRNNLGNSGEKTPRVSLSLDEDHFRNPRVTTSPTTSTPGSSPTGSSSNGLRESDLQSSEESVIETSATGKGISVDTDKGTPRKGRDPEEIEFIGMVNTSLTGNSEVEVSAQDVEDTSCETTQEFTNQQNMGALSCVANRTRTHTEEMRKENLTQLVGSFSMLLNSSSLEESFEVIQPVAADSLNLPRSSNREESDMESLRIWCDKLKIVDYSMDKISKIEGPHKQEKMTKLYKAKTAEVAKKNEDMKSEQEGEIEVEELEKEIKEIKSVTFVVEEPGYTSALQEVIKALETLVGMNLST